ncbi:lytic transglycosylase domain-containing protein [Burkholderia cenocepacia]|uniref:lytic transglycosylase domain-containing protein n=1 Tax=Burkholderia cenocepacia TaxID=95486 RepID=UPI000760DFAB|nr:lytic transglycosylase domain-containing protein [Burkholderia cenocepacia]KWU17812.1 hypothetical protein AS149_13915 [Burkholderia cenocepacia]
MDAIPSLPPYAHVTQEAVQCAAKASLRYDVPELLLHAILMKENGRVGKTSRNRNGSEDLGPAQINSSQIPRFAAMGLNRDYILNDFCTNIYVSAYILRENFNKKHDWFQAIVSYNIGPNNWTQDRYRIGYNYAVGVVRYWWSFQNYVDAQHGIRRVAAQSGAVTTAPGPTQKASSAGQQLVYSVAPDGEVAAASADSGQ